MIIEIKDLPPGCKIKSINCKIDFDEGGCTTTNVITSSQQPVSTQSHHERPENIAPEMKDLEF